LKRLVTIIQARADIRYPTSWLRETRQAPGESSAEAYSQTVSEQGERGAAVARGVEHIRLCQGR